QPRSHGAHSRMTQALWGYGFRPFFLAAGLSAAVLIPWWAGAVAWGFPLSTNWPPMLWHGHEMLFGFIVAAIAGFLLTAVPSWTGARGFAGTPLILLAALWLTGRLAFAAAAVLPLTIVAVCELAFIPVLAGLLAPALLRARNRNSPLLLVLVSIWLTDVVFMYALMRDDVLVAIDIVLLLVTVIGGRIVPAFTASALRARGLAANLRTSRWADGIVIAAMVALVFV